MHTKTAGIWAGWMLAMTATALTGQTSGSIAGRVTGGGGTGVGNAKVYLHSATTTFRLNTIANAGGVYRFDGLPAGKYEVCATPIGAEYVDSCLWNRMGFPVAVTAEARSAAVDITVQKAGKLQLAFADSQAVLEGAAARTKPIQVHVWTTTFVALPVFEAARSRTGRSYEIAVPVDVDVVLSIHGPPLRLTVGGAAYNTADKQVLRTRVDSAKETTKTVPVTVVGLAP